MTDDVNGWDHVNSDALAKDAQAVVGKADAPAPAVFEPVTIAGFTRIANDDDFKAFLTVAGPLDGETPRVPNFYPFWVRVSETYVPFGGQASKKELLVLSKDDVQSLMNCTQQAISLYGHWVIERRVWSLDEESEES